MRRRSKSCQQVSTNRNSRLRRTNSLGCLDVSVHERIDGYDVYNHVIDQFDIQECELSNHIRHMYIKTETVRVNCTKTNVLLGRCKKYRHLCSLPQTLSPESILCNSIGNLSRLRTLGIDVKCNLSISVLNKLTRLRMLSLYNVTMTGDKSCRLILPKLRRISILHCRIQGGTTYDLIDALNAYSTSIQTIIMTNMVGEYIIGGVQYIPQVSYRPLPVHNMRFLRDLLIKDCYLNASISVDCMSQLMDNASILSISNSLLTRIPLSTGTTSMDYLTVRVHNIKTNDGVDDTTVKYYDLHVIRN